MPVGSIRPPPVHFPVGHCAGGGVTQKLGRFGAMLTFGRSLHATASSPAAKPGPKRRIVCVSMLRLLAGSSTRDSYGEALARQVPVVSASTGCCGIERCVAVSPSCIAAHTSGVEPQSSRLHQNARATPATTEVAALRHCTERRGERRAVRSPLVAASLIHLPPQVTHTRYVSHNVSRDPSARAQRLRDGDRPTRLACRRGRPTVQFETLPVAHHPRDPLGGLAVPPLDHGSGWRAPRESALGRGEDGVALWLHQAVGPVRA